MNCLNDDSKYSITDSGWIMYNSLTENLNTLNKTLPISLFNKCWPMLATKFSTVSKLIKHINLYKLVYIVMQLNVTVYFQ